jgi:DNA-binding CsgD family transcriptional regulator
LDEIVFSGISFKFPIFGHNDKIIGVLGISTFTDKSLYEHAENLSNSMERIFQTRLIPQYRNLLPGFNLNDTYFSKQELKCLRLMVAGKTIKSIGQHLKLSPRTVEHYIENMKQKLNVSTKSDLIEKVIQQVWPEILI